MAAVYMHRSSAQAHVRDRSAKQLGQVQGPQGFGSTYVAFPANNQLKEYMREDSGGVFHSREYRVKVRITAGRN